MIYPEIPLAQSIIEICKGHHLKHIIISPGSRNAPLTIGFASNPFFKCYSIADERSAAFFALGIAQQIKEPVALICTSGSALLNYYPAIAEAFYSQIPLVIISADRPLSKIDIGDGQTIRQQNVYQNHILFNANLNEVASKDNDILLNTAIQESILKKGPVHVNAPFEEPLYNTVDEISVTPYLSNSTLTSPKIDILPFVDIWKNSSKKLILIGACELHLISQEVINYLATDSNVVVMTEVTSNIHHPNFIQHIDRFITPFTESDFKKLQPDLLVTFGGMVVSKRIKSFLRKYKPSKHWHIDELRHYDTYDSLTDKVRLTPNVFFNKLMKYKSDVLTSGYQSWAIAVANQRKIAHQQFIAQIPFSDMEVFDFIFKNIPAHLQLQISNSSPIRYAQLFELAPSIEVFCNRGTSGIDGCTSTAIGAATISEKPTLLITGDVSFFYDNNALWNNYIPSNFKIIILNNQGGGIFRILPGHQETAIFNTYFETEHQLTAEHLAKMHQFDYYKANSLLSLETAFTDFMDNTNRPAILEISTPTKINDSILKEYFKNLDYQTI